MHGAVEGYGGALEPLEVLVVADELQVGPADGFAQTDEAFPERLHAPGECTDEVQDPRGNRSIGAPDQPVEVRAGIVEPGGPEFRIEVAAEGLRIRHRGEDLRSQTKRQSELRQVAIVRLDVDVTLFQLHGQPAGELTDEATRHVRVSEILLCGIARTQVSLGVETR